ncbi:MAG: hypothetical protein IJH07_07830 [Ruminococcus sp.]|nr:hypothetical protein [Ruminococcus sp.]
MQKRIICVLLSVFLLFSVLTPAISAADTKISEIRFGLYEPENGDTPDFRVISDSSEHYEMSSLVWTETATGRELTKSDKFEYKKSYTATVTFQAKDGYAFASKDSLRIEYGFGSVYQKPSPDQLTAKSCTVRVTLVCTEGIIEAVSMLLTIPHAGYRSSTELSHLSSYCTLAGFRWIDESTGKALADALTSAKKASAIPPK